VLDTNVIVSAALTADGNCARIVRLMADGIFQMFADERLLTEYEAVLHRPILRIVPEDAAILLDLIRSEARRVTAAPLALDLPDPKDLPFVEVAAAVQAVLVTGNARHFPRSVRAGVSILTPREFIEALRRVP
jgi:putative PIN family toxin of toxin-antitoxin system